MTPRRLVAQVLRFAWLEVQSCVFAIADALDDAGIRPPIIAASTGQCADTG